MRKLSTITTYEDIVNLTRTYCVVKGVTVKDFIADLVKKELNGFEEWINNNKIK